MKANQRIRAAAIRKGVYLWEVAAASGMSESGFAKKMRFELPEEEQERLLSIIEEIAKERE